MAMGWLHWKGKVTKTTSRGRSKESENSFPSRKISLSHNQPNS
jgi:hypothetical protein